MSAQRLIMALLLPAADLPHVLAFAAGNAPLGRLLKAHALSISPRA